MKSLRKYRSMVIDVASTTKTLTEPNRIFEDQKSQADYELWRATTIYWCNLATVRERAETHEVDYVKDTPEQQGFFQENLKYLGLEVTPASHVDQVVRATVSVYTDRHAQGIFKHKWMMFLMKPFFWALLPFKFIGILNEWILAYLTLFNHSINS